MRVAIRQWQVDAPCSVAERFNRGHSVLMSRAGSYGLMDRPGPQAQCITFAGNKTRARAWLRFVAREPFFQFIVLGLLIWSGIKYFNADHRRYTIDLGVAVRERIADTYRRQFGQLPTPRQFEGLVDRYVREEIFLREGLTLNLDKNDEIVRRRIIQKYEFLQTDLAVPESPDARMLERWFEQHKRDYLTPERIAFSHIYFSADQDGEEGAKTRAREVLQKLTRTRAYRAPGLGDAFPGPSDIGTLTREEAARLFGKSELSEQVFNLPVGQWAGPYRSGYGWHLVYVMQHLPSALTPLPQIREKVLAAYMDDQRKTSNARAFEKLRSKYTIRDDEELR